MILRSRAGRSWILVLNAGVPSNASIPGRVSGQPSHSRRCTAYATGRPLHNRHSGAGRNPGMGASGWVPISSVRFLDTCSTYVLLSSPMDSMRDAACSCLASFTRRERIEERVRRSGNHVHHQITRITVQTFCVAVNVWNSSHGESSTPAPPQGAPPHLRPLHNRRPREEAVLVKTGRESRGSVPVWKRPPSTRRSSPARGVTQCFSQRGRDRQSERLPDSLGANRRPRRRGVLGLRKRGRCGGAVRLKGGSGAAGSAHTGQWQSQAEDSRSSTRIASR